MMGEETKTPRLPTAREKQQLIQYLLADRDIQLHKMSTAEKKRAQEEIEEVEGHVAQAYIAVFDTYVSGAPGYVGKVMVVVYNGDPEFTETYTWPDDGVLSRDLDLRS